MIYLLVFLSGAAALIYEVVWSRQLATFLGIASYAHTVVLATFMAGLALGSRFLGARADRHRAPLRFFGWLETGIGLYGLVGIWLMPLLQEVYATVARGHEVASFGAHAVRFAMAAGALLLPTFLMGGTLPALVRAADAPRLSRTIGRLYGANTLGAAFGALAAGYLLLPHLGTRGTVITAAICNVAVAIAILGPTARTWFKSPVCTNLPRAEGRRTPFAAKPPLLLALLLSGLAALTIQLAWVRALNLVIGSSVYAFSLTLATFLLGIALGSLLYARLLAPRLEGRSALTCAAVLEATVGLLVVLGLPLIGRLPELFLQGYRYGLHESFVTFQLFLLVLAASVILLPTMCLGALFPLLAALASPSATRVGRDVGTAAAANSVGTIFGAIAAGLVLLPWLGVQGTLIAAGGLHVAVAGILWLDRRPSTGVSGLRRLALPTVALVAFFLLSRTMPAWDPTVMTSGPYVNAGRILDVPAGLTFRDWIRSRNRLLFYAEGVDGNVSVREVADERLLVINGKTDGSLYGDRRTQFVIAHLPLLIHEEPRDVLVVGLGTGMSAGAASGHESVDVLDVLEVSPEVVEASRLFGEANRGILLDPRLRLLHADARNFLHTTNRLYDVIISEPSNPWISGIANLFTREFFTLALRRLAVGGIMSQWFHTYSMSQEDLWVVLKTYQEVFPFVTVWAPQLGDLVLIGSRTPHQLSLRHLGRFSASPQGVLDLLPLGLLEPRDWARMYLLGPEDVEDLVAGAELNTDDHPRVEFSAPKNLYAETTMSNMSRIVESLDGSPLEVPFSGIQSRDYETGDLEAFGLRLSPRTESDISFEWLVTWTEAFATEPIDPRGLQPSSRFAIGNRRVVRFGETEIGCGFTQNPLDTESLLEALTNYLPGQLDYTGSLELADGTQAVWAAASVSGEMSSQPEERFTGLAWTCGETIEGFSRFIATFPEPVSKLAGLGELSQQLHCALKRSS